MGNCIQVVLSTNKKEKGHGSYPRLFVAKLEKGDRAPRSNRNREFKKLKHCAKVFPVPVSSALPLIRGKAGNNPISPIPPMILVDDVSNRRIVKIVVRKKQLEELFKNMKELEASRINGVQFGKRFREKDRRVKYRWRPSVDTILE
ncbi:unnamed protein product [Amaranthus hypochondriacus]